MAPEVLRYPMTKVHVDVLGPSDIVAPTEPVFLKQRTHDIYTFIVRYHEQNGISPNVRAIGENVGLNSTSAVNHHLSKLRGAGCIVQEGSGAESGDNGKGRRNIPIMPLHLVHLADDDL